jgi:hypothetical protein
MVVNTEDTVAGKKKAKIGGIEESRPPENIAVASEDELDKAACNPAPVKRDRFNEAAVIPYGCIIDPIYREMNEVLDVLGFIKTGSGAFSAGVRTLAKRGAASQARV